MVYTLQEPYKGKLKGLKRQQIIDPLGMDEICKWCNSFTLVPKVNGKVRLCLDPARLNKVIISNIKTHRPTMYDILPRLAGRKYLTIIDANSGYLYLKLDEKLSHLTTFSFPFSRYRNVRLPYGAAPAGDMFKKKKVELFSEIANVFGTAEDSLITDFDEWG